MMKPLVLTLLITLLLAACASPAPQAGEPHSQAATLPAELAAPTEAPAEPAAAPTPTAPPATPEAACSKAPLAQGILISDWDESQFGYHLYPADPETGQPLCGYDPLLTSPIAWHSRSPDGVRLALIDLHELDKESRVRIVDLRTWQVSEFIVPIAGFVTRLAFSPSGAQLAVSYSLDINRGPDVLYTDELAVLDLEKGAVAAQSSLEISVRVLAFTPDGENLIVFGAPDGSRPEGKPPARAMLLDAGDLAAAWDQSFPDIQVGVTSFEMGEDQMPVMQYSEPGLAFSSATQTLYIVHPNQDRLTTVDFARRKVAARDILPEMSWFERLLSLTAGVAHAKGANGTTKQAVLSPDGQRLYVSGWVDSTNKNANGEWQFNQEPLGVQVIDLASGRQVQRLDIDATTLDLSADGRYLFLQASRGDLGWTQIVSTEDWEDVRSLTVSSLVAAQRLSGEAVLLSQRYSSETMRIAVLNPDDFEETASWDLLLGEMQENPIW